jgi:hypothetical protein
VLVLEHFKREYDESVGYLIDHWSFYLRWYHEIDEENEGIETLFLYCLTNFNSDPEGHFFEDNEILGMGENWVS